MKLFEFWLEVPSTLVEINPSLPMDITQCSKIFMTMIQKYKIAEGKIMEKIDQIEKENLITSDTFELKDGNKEETENKNFNNIKELYSFLKAKFEIIEKEKSKLVTQSVKTITRILSEILRELTSFNILQVNSVEKQQFFSRQRINLQLIRKVAEKAEVERNNLKLKMDEESKELLHLYNVFIVYIEKVISKIFGLLNNIIASQNEIKEKESELDTYYNDSTKSNSIKASNKDKKIKRKRVVLKEIKVNNLKKKKNKAVKRLGSKKNKKSYVYNSLKIKVYDSSTSLKLKNNPGPATKSSMNSCSTTDSVSY